jgi:hypothetical protein
MSAQCLSLTSLPAVIECVGNVGSSTSLIAMFLWGVLQGKLCLWFKLTRQTSRHCSDYSPGFLSSADGCSLRTQNSNCFNFGCKEWDRVWGRVVWTSLKEISLREHVSALWLHSLDRLCGLVFRVPGYRTEMYCVAFEVRTEFIYVM